MTVIQEAPVAAKGTQVAAQDIPEAAQDIQEAAQGTQKAPVALVVQVIQEAGTQLANAGTQKAPVALVVQVIQEAGTQLANAGTQLANVAILNLNVLQLGSAGTKLATVGKKLASASTKFAGTAKKLASAGKKLAAADEKPAGVSKEQKRANEELENARKEMENAIKRAKLDITVLARTNKFERCTSAIMDWFYNHCLLSFYLLKVLIQLCLALVALIFAVDYESEGRIEFLSAIKKSFNCSLQNGNIDYWPELGTVQCFYNTIALNDIFVIFYVAILGCMIIALLFGCVGICMRCDLRNSCCPALCNSFCYDLCSCNCCDLCGCIFCGICSCDICSSCCPLPTDTEVVSYTLDKKPPNNDTVISICGPDITYVKGMDFTLKRT